MVNNERITDEFLRLLRIDSLSLQERDMADCLKSILASMGLEVYEDNAGTKIDGNSGNIIAKMRGDKQVPAVILSAHMDTVGPGKNKQPKFLNGKFSSDGTTILGGDNIAGIAIILETLRTLKEEKVTHGDIQVVFSVAEELSLMGISNLDVSLVDAAYAIVLDCEGKPGTIAYRSSAYYNVDVVVKGKAAHAGIEPEKGISAVKIASLAISGMKLGRIDDVTTANIGFVNGGKGRNIICDRIDILGEVRSLDDEKLNQQLWHMRECFENAAAFYNGEIEFNSYIKFPALKIDENASIIDILKEAAKDCGLIPDFITTGGGSDANIFGGMGIQTANIAIGMNKLHTTEETILLEDMLKSVEFLHKIIINIR